MEENEKEVKSKQLQTIDLGIIAKKLWIHKKSFLKTLPVTFVLASVFILGFPRTYDTDVKLAPEIDNPLSTGSLSSLASSFGFDLNSIKSSDAINPLLYPDLMEDNKFVASLFDVKVVSEDGKIKTTYHDYLQKYQKPVLWLVPINWIKGLFSKKEGKSEGTKHDPYLLPKEENDIANAIRGNVKLSFDKKTSVITIQVKAQDPLICKIMGDSVRSHLQKFITEYRTNKARIDYHYYKKLAEEAKQSYETARRKYSNLADANTNISLRSVEILLEDYENDMQLKFNTYTTLNTQLEASKAKVQERTPAFSVIKGAALPLKPTGPKRMIFVVAMVMLCFIIQSMYIIIKK